MSFQKGFYVHIEIKSDLPGLLRASFFCLQALRGEHAPAVHVAEGPHFCSQLGQGIKGQQVPLQLPLLPVRGLPNGH